MRPKVIGCHASFISEAKTDVTRIELIKLPDAEGRHERGYQIRWNIANSYKCRMGNMGEALSAIIY